MRELHRVSTKALILNKSMDKILLIHITRWSDWGLPGGEPVYREFISSNWPSN